MQGNLIPKGNRLVCSLVKEENKSGSGLILGKEKKASNIVEIISMSSDIEDEDMEIGDKIVVSYKNCEMVDVGEDSYIVVDVEDVLAIVVE